MFWRPWLRSSLRVISMLELEFVLRPTVSRPVSLGIRPPFGTLDQILSCSAFVWQLRCSAFNASSLTRVRVCNLLLYCFWALPVQSHLSRSPTKLTAISYCLLWDSPNLEGQVPVFISPRNRVAQDPWALGSLSVASYDSQGLRWKYSNPLISMLELEFFLRPTVSQPVRLGIGPPFGIFDQILSCSSAFVWQLRRFAINESSLTRKRVCNFLYNCFWALPEQSHLSPSPTELTVHSFILSVLHITTGQTQ
jgi:hypothetical protein